MVICTKQHLNNIWSSIHEKLSNTEDELKKGVAYIKTCILVWFKNSSKWKITMTMWNIEYALSVSQASGAESLARIRNNFLVQIIRSLSKEGRVFLRRRKILLFDFNRLILLFEWESVAKLVIIFALAPDEGRLMWVKIVKSLFWCCCYYISRRTL